jgi:hypothetical protein
MIAEAILHFLAKLVEGPFNRVKRDSVSVGICTGIGVPIPAFMAFAAGDIGSSASLAICLMGGLVGFVCGATASAVSMYRSVVEDEHGQSTWSGALKLAIFYLVLALSSALGISCIIMYAVSHRN